MAKNDKRIDCDNGCTHKKTITFTDKLENAFSGLVESYISIFNKKFIPTRDKIGFTERNLTFYFCQSFINENPNAIVWQEMPIKDENQHLDSIIIDEEEGRIHFCLIESKRIYNANYVGIDDQNKDINPRPKHGTLVKDYNRLKNIITNINVNEIPGLKDFAEEKKKQIEYHIVQLASLEHMKNNQGETFKNRNERVKSFIKAKKYTYHKIIKIKNISPDYEELYLYLLADSQLE